MPFTGVETLKHCKCGGALALLTYRMAPNDIDFVHSVTVALGFAENRAMLPLQIDPRDRKRVVLGAAAKAQGDRVADCDPGRQADMLIGLAGRGDEPTAALGQHPQGVRYDGLDVLGRGPTETTRED